MVKKADELTELGHFLRVELQAVKVADANGNPLVISGVVNYRVVDPTRAALDVLHLGGVLCLNCFLFTTGPAGAEFGMNEGHRY